MLKIDDYIEKKTTLINTRLKELCSPIGKLDQNKLLKLADYFIHPEGKRLRSILVFATVDTFTKDSKKALDVACAIELLHSYSLIHDDLPCMDNDDLRRNKPSLHKAFSEWEALLCGDFLLTYAFEVITNAANLSDNQKIRIISVLTKRAGLNGMIGGQYIDMASQSKNIEWKKIQLMHEGKTASLFSASLEAGAIIANANEKETIALSNFGGNIGIAYQILDDILDLTVKEKILGKSTKSDLKKKKATAVSALGLEEAQKQVRHYYDKAIMYLSALSYPPPLLKNLAYKLIKRNY